MVLDCILKRQSSRSYLPTPVPRSLIEQCLEAARLAPSACNAQPWHFIVIDDPCLKNRFCEKVFSGPYALNAFARQAPAFLIVVSEKSSLAVRLGGFFRQTVFSLLDVGIAVEHFVLQAAASGLSTCWIGWFNEREAKKILKIPGAKKLDCIICLGYSNETLREKNRKNLNEISSFNVYQNPRQ